MAGYRWIPKYQPDNKNTFDQQTSGWNRCYFYQRKKNQRTFWLVTVPRRTGSNLKLYVFVVIFLKTSTYMRLKWGKLLDILSRTVLLVGVLLASFLYPSVFNFIQMHCKYHFNKKKRRQLVLWLKSYPKST